MLWRCWLGGRKGIRPVKTWVVGCWCGYLAGARWTCIRTSWCHCHSLSFASVKSRLVLPFWYRLTRVVLDKGPLNVCVCVINSRLHKIHKQCQTNDSPIDYNCKTTRQKTARMDNLKHTQAVSSANRVRCLASLVHTTWYKYKQLIQQLVWSLDFRNMSLKNTHTNTKNKKKVMNTQTLHTSSSSKRRGSLCQCSIQGGTRHHAATHCSGPQWRRQDFVTGGKWGMGL